MPRRSNTRANGSESDRPAPVLNPPRGRPSRATGTRGGGRRRRQMPVESDQEEIDITLSDRSVSVL